MNILLTGASGFLGNIICNKLSGENHLITLGRNAPCNSTDHIICDLGRQVPIFGSGVKIDMVVHAAGKAHIVPRSLEEADNFYEVNYKGTLRLLEGLDALPVKPRAIVFISTVAVYGYDKGTDIDEGHKTNGNSPYALSKIKAEAALREWAVKNNLNCTILRLPLIAGANPPGNLGKMINTISKSRYIRISGNHARKSMVLGEDVARLIPSLCDRNGIFNLTDGEHPSFYAIEEAIRNKYKKNIYFIIPKWLLKGAARLGDLCARFGLPALFTSETFEKITCTLTFSDDKARKELNWKPHSSLTFLQ
ncbi:NAD-dependent epimerase/dehydratase family protein [Chitinophaga barathri]|nr:NAD-dependent epimerase/dehydratase family protein [Chitinophaga barathri]